MRKPTLILGLVLLGSACAGIKPVAYTAQPLRVTDPHAELKNLILANTTQGCVTEPSFSGSMLVVKAVCSRGVGNFVARLDQIDRVVLEQSGDWYGCRVKHKGGAEDFFWSSKSLDDMQRMADAFTALSEVKVEKKTATTDT